jgi:hypothetical protein
MFEFLKSKQFHIAFSFIIGLFLVLILRPTCKDENCIERKNPSVEEITSATYQLGSKCFQFKNSSVDCVK